MVSPLWCVASISLNSLNSLNNSSILFQNNPSKHWNHSTNQQTDSQLRHIALCFSISSASSILGSQEKSFALSFLLITPGFLVLYLYHILVIFYAGLKCNWMIGKCFHHLITGYNRRWVSKECRIIILVRNSFYGKGFVVC